MNYPMYGNNQQIFMKDLQSMRDRIDNQMRQIQMQNQQMPMQQQPITQNFQLAPNPTNNELESKYVENFDDVKNTFVMKTGIFPNKDLSTIWVKDVSGNIRTFKTEEVIEQDPKDQEIAILKQQIEEMKGMINNELSNANVNEPTSSTKSQRVSNSKYSNAKQQQPQRNVATNNV